MEVDESMKRCLDIKRREETCSIVRASEHRNKKVLTKVLEINLREVLID